jgi:hypothetical protein
MSCRTAGLILGTILATCPPAEAAQSVYTPTHGQSCQERFEAEFAERRCRGPAGYIAEYSDEGNMAALAVWAPGRRRRAQETVIWRGAGRVFGDILEWRIDAGQPTAAILRIWRTFSLPDGAERETEELILLKVLPSGSCRIASLDARQIRANEIAREISAQYASMTCLKK